jgi:ArsR family metal-binding transcriptional regulator
MLIMKVQELIPLAYQIEKEKILPVIHACWKTGKGLGNINRTEVVDTPTEAIEILDFIMFASKDSKWYSHLSDKTETVRVYPDSIYKYLRHRKVLTKKLTLTKAFIKACKECQPIDEYHGML